MLVLYVTYQGYLISTFVLFGYQDASPRPCSYAFGTDTTGDRLASEVRGSQFCKSTEQPFENNRLTPKMSDSPGPGHLLEKEEEEGISVALTHETLSPLLVMNKVKSPKAGAIVLFAGM